MNQELLRNYTGSTIYEVNMTRTLQLIAYLIGVTIFSFNYYELKSNLNPFVFVWISGFYIVGISVFIEWATQRLSDFMKSEGVLRERRKRKNGR